VHFTPGDQVVRPGDFVTVDITYAAPHHLVSDAPVRSVRRTRAGDAATATSTTGVALGMPTLGQRALQGPVAACGLG
jgi:tRNA-2-methylthio-N6-dimethylallyladenosine synthase